MQNEAAIRMANDLADKLEWALKLLKNPALYMGKPERLETFEKPLQAHADFVRSLPPSPAKGPELTTAQREAIKWALLPPEIWDTFSQKVADECRVILRAMLEEPAQGQCEKCHGEKWIASGHGGGSQVPCPGCISIGAKGQEDRARVSLKPSEIDMLKLDLIQLQDELQDEYYTEPGNHEACFRLECRIKVIKSALTQPSPPDGWRPIESAPRDGTQILGKVDYTDQMWTVVYFGTFHPNSPGKPVWRDAFSKRPVADFSCWQPLPQPPTQPERGEK